MKKLCKKELNKLSNALDHFEMRTLVECGIAKISGGYAIASMFDYDDEYIDIELKWGIQSDCEDTTHTEQFKLLRSKLNDKRLSAKTIAEWID